MQSRIKKKEWKELRTIWDLWDNIKRPNIQIIGVPEEKRKRKGLRKYVK